MDCQTCPNNEMWGTLGREISENHKSLLNGYIFCWYNSFRYHTDCQTCQINEMRGTYEKKISHKIINLHFVKWIAVSIS